MPPRRFECRVVAGAGPLIAVVALLVGCSSAPDNSATPAEGKVPVTGSAGNAAVSTVPSAAEHGFTVTRGAFNVAYRLDGATRQSEAVGVDVPTGLDFVGSARAGATVRAGDRIGALRIAPEIATGLDAEATAGTVGTSRRAALKAASGPVRAPVAGVLVSAAKPVRIARLGIDVAVPLTPLQVLRYRGLALTGEATVETVVGQRRVGCAAIWVVDLEPSAQGAGGQDGAPVSSEVHCRLPDDVETASGLPAVLALTAPTQDDVVAVPLSLLSLDQSGKNYVVLVRSGSRTTPRPVVVGATDGVRRVVLSGLETGDVLVPPPIR